MTGRIDMARVSVIVSVKVDSADRIANLARVLDFYERFGADAEVIAVEQGPAPQIDAGAMRGARHVFLRSDGCHWKTRNMNFGAKVSARPILLMSDCDTVPHPEALAEGLAGVDAGADFVQLYDGVVVNVSKRLAASFRDWDDCLARVRTVAPDEVDPAGSSGDPDQYPLYGNADYRAVGGCFLCRREAFFAAGGWNENFVSYGFEDMELDLRVARLGFRTARVEGRNLYHFDHARGPDSRYATFYRLNEREYERVRAMTPEALQHYANRGFRALEFRHGRDYARASTPEEECWRASDPAHVDLSDLTIVVVADASAVAYGASCLRPFMDYLEASFRDHDLRLCELGGTGYKHIHNKLNVTYRSWNEASPDAVVAEALAEAGRPRHYILRLSADARAQLDRAMVPFERVRAGAPLHEVFARADAPSARRAT